MTSAAADRPDSAKAAATQLAALGFRVFPIKARDKTPAYEGWKYAASSAQDAIERNFRSAHNVGIATGQGLLVIDIDVKRGKAGLASLDAMQQEHGELPKTRLARTPTGGLHLYFRYDESAYSPGNRGGFRPGIDARGEGGYVVAPPSITEEGAYVWLDERETAQAPQWLLNLVGQRAERTEREARKGVEYDGDAVTSEAIRFLSSTAPAIEGQGGDHRTFTVAARLRDLGLPKTAALDLLLQVYNPRCSPPWDPDELATKVHNAYAYAQNAQGSSQGDALFDDDETAQRAREQMRIHADLRAQEAFTALRPAAVASFSPETLPPRQWIIERTAIAGKLTVLISPGGVGKSTLTLLAALACATGRSDLLRERIRPHLHATPIPLGAGEEDEAEALARQAHNEAVAACPVWVFNNEDDEEELLRRTYAAMKLHDIAPESLKDGKGVPRLYVNSGQSRPFTVAVKAQAGGAAIIVPKDANAIAAHIVTHGIKLLIVDPFVETHGASENDNVEINAVARIYRQIAQITDCAIILVHHTRKHPAASADSAIGDADSGRGAGALMNAARVGLTLYSMTEDDARTLGVPERERWKYIRLDDAKANLSAPRQGLDAARWFARRSVELPTSSGALEIVGALESWDWTANAAADVDDAGLDIAVAAALDSAGGTLPLRRLAEDVAIGPVFAAAGLSADNVRKKIERRYHNPVSLEDSRIIRFVGAGGDGPRLKERGRRPVALEILHFDPFS